MSEHAIIQATHEAYSPQFGARPIKYFIQKQIERN